MSEQQTPAQIVPNFWVESVEALRTFYLEKLGFEHMMGVVGKDGKLDFTIVTREGLMVMIGRPEKRIDGSGPTHATDRPVELYLYVKDVDAFFAEVAGRKVEISDPLHTQWWGDRTFSVKDPYGYTIWFCQTVGAPEPPPGVTMI